MLRLNRAAAVAQRDGPAAALVEVERISGLRDYPWWHASWGEFLDRPGNREVAAAAAGKTPPRPPGKRRRGRPGRGRAALDEALTLGLDPVLRAGSAEWSDDPGQLRCQPGD